jgi:hypothetical protein
LVYELIANRFSEKIKIQFKRPILQKKIRSCRILHQRNQEQADSEAFPSSKILFPDSVQIVIFFAAFADPQPRITNQITNRIQINFI